MTYEHMAIDDMPSFLNDLALQQDNESVADKLVQCSIAMTTLLRILKDRR